MNEPSYSDKEWIARGQTHAIFLKWVKIVGLPLLFLLTIGLWGWPQYSVWQQKLAGEAELRRAEYNRQIAVQEANAKKESAELLAASDTLRARGAAVANLILGESLKGNEEYLRYLWIQGISEQSEHPQIIYVPTEAGLPILEAGKR